MSNQTAKLKKQKKREQKNRIQKLFEQKKRLEQKRRQTYRDSFPEFRFETENGDPDFVECVKEALKTISFEDRTVFQDWETDLYRLLKWGGASAVWNVIRSMKQNCLEAGNQAGQFLDLHFLCNIGQAVFDRMPVEKREHYFPFNDVRFIPQGNYISCIFRSLLREKGPMGTIFYSRHRPTLEIDGVRKVVGFSRHAIERICERIKPRWRDNFAALGDVFAFFDQCTYFETCKLYGDQLAFTFFNECADGYWTYLYVLEVFGEEKLDPKEGKPYHRVGYCPAVIDGEFVKAKTLLLPGNTRTPEFDAICQSSLPGYKKKLLLQEMKEQNASTASGVDNFGLVKVFHDQGVPQVVQLNGPVYASAF